MISVIPYLFSSKNTYFSQSNLKISRESYLNSAFVLPRLSYSLTNLAMGVTSTLTKMTET